jgi:hypothetical protein
MLTAIIGLVGVLAGVVITGLWQVHLERRRERRALRLAARVVNDEIRWALLGVTLLLREDSWRGAVSANVIGDWREYRAALARI